MPEYLEEVRCLAEAWRRDLDAVADSMYSYLAERIPGTASDATLASMTRAACMSNVELILAMIDNGLPVSAAEAPIFALEHARLMAKRGAEVDDTLRFYRLGHGFFLDRWAQDIQDVTQDPQRRLAALTEMHAFAVEYVDRVSSQVSREHLDERERRQRHAQVIRAEAVRALLAGEVVDVAGAERTLGHRLDRPQLAFICWTDTAAQLEPAVLAVAAVIGEQRPLMVPEGPSSMAAWTTPSREWPADQAALDRCLAQEHGVRVAFGTPGPGVQGFRESHDQAGRGQRVATLLDAKAPRCTYFADIALFDLLTSDVGAARNFLASELKGLCSAEPAIAALRETLLAVVRPRGGIASAARALDLHRNTVVQRLHRAEQILGRSVEERGPELYVALMIAAGLPRLLEHGRPVSAGRLAPLPSHSRTPQPSLPQRISGR